MKFRNRRATALVAVALAAGLALTACGSKNDSGSDSGDGGGSGGGGKRHAHVFLPKNLGNPYFDTSDKAGQKAVESFGGTYQEVGPDTAGPTPRCRSSTPRPSRASRR